MVTHSDTTPPVLDSSSQSAFESKPQQSRASISHGTSAEPVDGQSVFESQPAESKASARAGVEAEDGSEYTTDDEEEEETKK